MILPVVSLQVVSKLMRFQMNFLAQPHSPRRRSRRPQTNEVKVGVLRWRGEIA
jgi:hypothetical protein